MSTQDPRSALNLTAHERYYSHLRPRFHSLQRPQCVFLLAIPRWFLRWLARSPPPYWSMPFSITRAKHLVRLVRPVVTIVESPPYLPWSRMRKWRCESWPHSVGQYCVTNAELFHRQHYIHHAYAGTTSSASGICVLNVVVSMEQLWLWSSWLLTYWRFGTGCR